MVRYVRPADGTEQDRIGLCETLHAISRHHRTGLLVGLARPVVMREVEAETEAPRGSIQYLQRLGHGLLADAVAGDDCDPVRLCHGLSPSPSMSYQRMVISARGVG